MIGEHQVKVHQLAGQSALPQNQADESNAATKNSPRTSEQQADAVPGPLEALVKPEDESPAEARSASTTPTDTQFALSRSACAAGSSFALHPDRAKMTEKQVGQQAAIDTVVTRNTTLQTRIGAMPSARAFWATQLAVVPRHPRTHRPRGCLPICQKSISSA